VYEVVSMEVKPDSVKKENKVEFQWSEMRMVRCKELRD